MSSSSSVPQPPKDGIDFISLPWNLNLPNEHSYLHLKTTTGNWDEYENATTSTLLQNSTKSYGPIEFCYPAMTSLNYGTTIWEGLKCYRTTDSNGEEQVWVFRPDQNYERMKRGANEMCLPMPSKKLFLSCIQHIIHENSHLIPPIGHGMKLYIRPILFGSGQQLGLYPSQEFSFIVFVSPTGSYFGNSTVSPGLQLHLETRRSRAARGGMGSVKCSGNYAAALKPLMDCKKHGFQDNLFLELDTYYTTNNNINAAVVQEMSAANVFFVLITGEIVTPSLDRGTILPGVTRASVLRIIEMFAEEILDSMKRSISTTPMVASADGGLQPKMMIQRVYGSSRDITVGEIKECAIEAFCTGTAAEIVPIARIATSPDDTTAEPFECIFPHGDTVPGGPVTTTLLQLMRDVMYGKRPIIPKDDDDKETWIRNPFGPAEEFCQ